MAKDFHTVKRDLDFTIDGEQFTTKGAVPATRLLDLQDAMLGMVGKDANAGLRAEGYKSLKIAYQGILTEDSFNAFNMRLDGEEDDVTPIDFALLMQITQWLIGAGLGKDHLPPQSSSQDG